MSKIVINPQVCNGRPVIEGTRIAVQSILEYLGAGDKPEDIIAEFPFLEIEDIQSCIRYASKCMANKFIIKEIAWSF